MANQRDVVSEALNRAVELREQKEQVYEAIGANRRFLRDLAAQGLLNEEQTNWVRDFYPPKKVGEKEKVAA